MVRNYVPSTWVSHLPFDSVKLGNDLAVRAEMERNYGSVIYPPQNFIFRALELVPPHKVKAVIVGQDPYHGPGQANGLAFSVNPRCPIPPSLRNIFKELNSDLNIPIPYSGDLTAWAEQGVLLLNTVLTVEAGQANSHKNWGWQNFVLEVLRACVNLPQPIVFILWGGQARAFTSGLQISQKQNKACIWSSHPSPLGATKGNEVVPAFIGSKPFSMTNRYLQWMGSDVIDWSL